MNGIRLLEPAEAWAMEPAALQLFNRAVTLRGYYYSDERHCMVTASEWFADAARRMLASLRDAVDKELFEEDHAR